MQDKPAKKKDGINVAQLVGIIGTSAFIGFGVGTFIGITATISALVVKGVKLT